MRSLKKILPLLLAFAPALAASAAPGPDFVICATLNRGYIIGAKLVTTSGTFRRDEAGLWHHFGANESTMTAAAFDPRDSAVCYTSANNGCWRTLDGGQTWRMLNSWDMTEARDVVLDPSAPDTIYLALPDGLAVSTDRGQTLVRRETGLPVRGKYTQAIAVDRTRAGRVFAGCESGLYLTEDSAQSWRCVLPTHTMVDDIQQSPHDPRHWLAVTQSDGAWSSRDRGATWKKIAAVPSTHPIYNITFDPTNPQRLALGGWTPGVLTSEDGGQTWTDRNAGLPASHCVWRVGVDASSGRLYASVVKEALYASEDFGRTWKRDSLEGSLVHRFYNLPKAAK